MGCGAYRSGKPGGDAPAKVERELYRKPCLPPLCPETKKTGGNRDGDPCSDKRSSEINRLSPLGCPNSVGKRGIRPNVADTLFPLPVFFWSPRLAVQHLAQRTTKERAEAVWFSRSISRPAICKLNGRRSIPRRRIERIRASNSGSANGFTR